MREEAMEEGLGPEDAGAASAAMRDADRKAAVRARDRMVRGIGGLVSLASSAEDPEDPLRAWLGRAGGLESMAAFLVIEALTELVEGSERERGARRLAEKLAIARKLREALQQSGVPGHEAWHGMHLALIFAGSPAWASATSSGLLELLATLDMDDELRNFFGVNVWDGTTWFKRESMDDFLAFGTLAALVRGGAGAGGKAPIRKKAEALPQTEATPASRRPVLEADLASARGAEAASGYRLEGFLAAIALGLPKKKPSRSPETARGGAVKKGGAAEMGRRKAPPKPASGTAKKRG